MSDPVIVLDAGVLDLLPADQEFRAAIRSLPVGGWTPLIPTVVLAEAITGRPTDAAVNQLVKRIGTVDTTGLIARQAGRLRFRANEASSRRVSSGIDAIVAAHAVDGEEGVVFTTDVADLRRLLADHPNVRIERP